jgi:hypothetical protein
VVGDGLESQIEQAYRNILELLRSVGATQENVVKQTILVAKGQDIRAGYAAAQKAWGAHPIAITVHIVDGFGIPGALVAIEAVCARWENSGMTEVYLALLRGVNVGGKNKVPIAALKACFEELGCENVRAYIASGNVMFESNKSSAELTEEIQKLYQRNSNWIASL